jgi:hypothetical protein
LDDLEMIKGKVVPESKHYTMKIIDEIKAQFPEKDNTTQDQSGHGNEEKNMCPCRE